jgi:hypothetical protein
MLDKEVGMARAMLDQESLVVVVAVVQVRGTAPIQVRLEVLEHKGMPEERDRVSLYKMVLAVAVAWGLQVATEPL